MTKEVTPSYDDEEEEAERDGEEAKAEKKEKPAVVLEDETVNSASALWTKARQDIKDEDYNEFYKHVSHDWQEPLVHVHSKVEGTNEFTLLLYVPSRAPFDLWDRNQKHGVKLYVRKIFIMDDAEELMPRYLRFIRGIVDAGFLAAQRVAGNLATKQAVKHD